MAQQVLVQLLDDLDGTTSPDVSTVVFGLDGVHYEIDLSEANAQRLRDQLADYVDKARRVGGRLKRGTKSRPARDTNSASEAGQIREWARQNGFELAGRGRIPAHVVTAYREAQSEEKKPAKTGAAARSPAKRRPRATKR